MVDLPEEEHDPVQMLWLLPTQVFHRNFVNPMILESIPLIRDFRHCGIMRVIQPVVHQLHFYPKVGATLTSARSR